jgi:hypothetical protein
MSRVNASTMACVGVTKNGAHRWLIHQVALLDSHLCLHGILVEVGDHELTRFLGGVALVETREERLHLQVVDLHELRRQREVERGAERVGAVEHRVVLVGVLHLRRAPARGESRGEAPAVEPLQILAPASAQAQVLHHQHLGADVEVAPQIAGQEHGSMRAAGKADHEHAVEGATLIPIFEVQRASPDVAPHGADAELAERLEENTQIEAHTRAATLVHPFVCLRVLAVLDRRSHRELRQRMPAHTEVESVDAVVDRAIVEAAVVPLDSQAEAHSRGADERHDVVPDSEPVQIGGRDTHTGNTQTAEPGGIPVERIDTIGDRGEGAPQRQGTRPHRDLLFTRGGTSRTRRERPRRNDSGGGPCLPADAPHACAPPCVSSVQP